MISKRHRTYFSQEYFDITNLFQMENIFLDLSFVILIICWQGAIYIGLLGVLPKIVESVDRKKIINAFTTKLYICLKTV